MFVASICVDENVHSYVSERATDGTEASSSDESEEDPEFRELEERSQIVEKYERGPEQEVEEWENPDLELYKVTDRYGFMHKDAQEVSLQELAEKKQMAKEVSREQKWLRMISRWTSGRGASDKFRKRVWKGIPEKLRSLVWARLLGINQYQQEQKGNVYRELLMRARLVSKDIKQIDLDINRTYRDHLAFRRRYDVKQQSLFNVLAAYAMYNTEVGYCQGMSQIAALFLMYMDEEEAFWCLHALLVDKKHSMHGFFVPGFPKLVRFQSHFEKILQKYLPRLKRHLDKVGIPPIYVTKWWFGCFLDRVPFPLALRLWDVFLQEGDVILIAMAYNIMKMHETTIRKLQMENFMEYIQTVIAQDFGFSDEETMKSLQECLRKLHNDKMLLPAPPGPNNVSETPTKPFGPVLSRSMIDIRLDIAEIQSRSSRANSVAGRSPAVVRRPRLPPSPTPVSKYKPSRLPSRMGPVVLENSHSSLSSTSTLKDASSREQQPTKILTDTTNNARMLLQSSESQKISLQQQPSPTTSAATPTIATTLLQLKTTRPSFAEGVQCSTSFSDKNSSSFSIQSPSRSMRNQELESTRQQEQPSSRPKTLLSEQSSGAGTGNLWSSSPTVATRHFKATVQHEVNLPSKEPPFNHGKSSNNQLANSFTSVHSVPSTIRSQASPVNATPSFCNFSNSVLPRRNDVMTTNDYMLASPASSKFSEFDETLSKFRSDYNDSHGSQEVIERSQRGSFYDNVPSPTRTADSKNMPQSHATDDYGDIIYRLHAGESLQERRYRLPAHSPTLLETSLQRRTTEVETRVVQLPNNVTCVSVGDNVNNTQPFRRHFDIPVRTEHVWPYEDHFPTQADQLETILYECNACLTSERLPSRRRPLRTRPEQHHYSNEKF